MEAVGYQSLRQSAGLSRKELAVRAGLTPSTISRHERLRTPLDPRSERAIRRALGLEPPAPTHASDGARLVELSDGTLVAVDAEDYVRIGWHRWTAEPKGYAHRRIPGTRREVQLHREILHAPDGWDVHHADGDPRNNRRGNLVLMPAGEHRAHHNREYAKSGGPYSGRAYKGVYRGRRDGTWQAKLWMEGRELFLGCHDTAEEAAVVYDAAVIALRGPGAFTNLVPNP